MGAMAVLGCLFRNGDLTIGDLAAHERVQPPSMTRIVNSLADGGYVVRRAHETDGRQVVVVLSDQGRTTLLADRARRDAWLAQRLGRLTTDERDTLRRAAPILERLANSD
jgi:DNA-binding MarR family transcriptional regulator